MIDTEIAKIEPKVLWRHSNVCSRQAWAYVLYRTPSGVEGRLIYDSDDDRLWWDITSGNELCLPWFSRHMNALLPTGTVCLLHDKHRRWNTADFIVGVDERLRWRY